MVSWVLDTSVVVKWFLPEPGTEAAERYLESLLAGDAVAFVPSSLFYELANVLWVRRRDGVTEETALAIWAELRRLPLIVAEWGDLLPDAISASHRYGISVYDAVFVQLALNRKCGFVTADQKLVRQTAKACPWVKPL